MGNSVEIPFEFKSNKSVKQKYWSAKRPWRQPLDSLTAINYPDLYAWQLFVSLNWPTLENRCKSDSSSKLGDPGLTNWEAWPSRDSIFLEGAKRPAPWYISCMDDSVDALPLGEFSNFEDETVRLNKIAFNYIRNNMLYSLDEHERLASLGVKDLDFPLGSRAVKAYWVRIQEADKHRYHWNEIVREGETVIFGLTALHILSKESPSWFWSTFEHEDNEHIWSKIHPSAFLGWVVPSVDRVACPEDNLACNRIPENYGLEGTKWENYRLRGTQTNWTDNRGNPTVLANSQIEWFMDQETSSCITCHALAVKGADGGMFPIPIVRSETNSAGLPFGHVGALDPYVFSDSNGDEIKYIGYDYLWTLRNAKRKIK